MTKGSGPARREGIPTAVLSPAFREQISHYLKLRAVSGVGAERVLEELKGIFSPHLTAGALGSLKSEPGAEHLLQAHEHGRRKGGPG